ncbi:hypothetical protein RRG08_006121 [Elysia crispata]|uniref:Uncharacterized protein n=1 Tax=Elysia crispata TaxID=231223 RepID=A0AAE0Y2Y5_9GAST|nr:hypothetical protein RRG08_006121 [Elysia crispata]
MFDLRKRVYLYSCHPVPGTLRLDEDWDRIKDNAFPGATRENKTWCQFPGDLQFTLPREYSELEELGYQQLRGRRDVEKKESDMIYRISKRGETAVQAIFRQRDYDTHTFSCLVLLKTTVQAKLPQQPFLMSGRVPPDGCA